MLSIIPHPFFSDLTAELAQDVVRLLKPVSLTTGDVLFRQGTVGDSAYFITHGKLAVDINLPGGEVSRIAEAGHGKVVGELALMASNNHRTATISALEDTQMLAMQCRDLQALCAHFHPAALILMEKLQRQLREAIGRMDRERMQLACAPIAHLPVCYTRREGASFQLPAFVQQLDFFHAFSRSEINEFLAMATVWTLDRGSVLFSPQESNGSTYLVLRGSLDICAQIDEDIRRLTVIGPGRLCRDSGDWSADALPAFALVREHATVLEFTAETMHRLKQPENQLSYQFLSANMYSLMERLTIETRAVSRERRSEALL